MSARSNRYMWRQRYGKRLPAYRLRKLARVLPAEVLGSAYAARFGTSDRSGRRMVVRLRTETSLTLDQADRWCVVLGTHLAAIYPELYEEAA